MNLIRSSKFAEPAAQPAADTLNLFKPGLLAARPGSLGCYDFVCAQPHLPVGMWAACPGCCRFVAAAEPDLQADAHDVQQGAVPPVWLSSG